MKKISHLLGYKALFAAAVMLVAPAIPAGAQELMVAQDSCFAAGQKYSNAEGATLVGAESTTKDGKSVCKVVVLYEASNGNRPRREIVYLPQ